MIVWEDFMAEDVTLCGVFDGHGPYGHLVARKVRDALPLKLLSFMYSGESKQNGSTTTCCTGNLKSDGGDPEKDGATEDNMDSLWRDTFLKSFKAMDKELRSHPNLDCFCSGSTAVTIVKQVWDVLSNEEVVEIVSSVPTRSSAARILVDSAAREWKSKYPTSKMDDCAVVCLFLDGKMDSESDYDEQGFSSATLQSNHSGNVLESDDGGQNSEPSLQRNFTVRSSEENDPNKRLLVEAEVNEETVVYEDQDWSGLEGVTRVNSLVQLPRFSEERPKTS
ncbi:hypothetical protein CsSME_00019628 [Camellia sinensis var. sinensis]